MPLPGQRGTRYHPRARTCAWANGRGPQVDDGPQAIAAGREVAGKAFHRRFQFHRTYMHHRSGLAERAHRLHAHFVRRWTKPTA